jgi:uncharacterized protein YbaR (Trm112 family)/SAM-dependent methyltransferase
MIEMDISYLKCISCFGKLKLESYLSDKEEGCIEGRLSCQKCKKAWPIINGIPRMLPENLMKELVIPRYPEFFRNHKFGNLSDGKSPKCRKEKLKVRTAQSFGFEWLKYPKILEQFESDWERYFHPFIKKQDIRGKVVADFGCGMAKHGYFSGKYKAKKYIGLDLSEAVEAAYQNTKEFRPLIVQADIYNLPLNGKEIDIFYSIGVLHHLPDPKGGFLSIAGLMKKGSKILIWVYGKRKNAKAIYIYNPARKITTRLPRRILYPLCHIPAMGTHALNYAHKALRKAGLGQVAQKIPFSYYADYPYRFKVSDCFDLFGTPKQSYHEMPEIKEWFRKAKIKNPKLEYDIAQGIKGFGRK